MGCSQSRGAKSNRLRRSTSATLSEKALGASIGNPSLSTVKRNDRIEHSKEDINVTIQGVDIKYAWRSLRGFYPETPNKDNQDAYLALTNYGGIKNQALFGVFDGHGRDGHHVARYVRDHLPTVINDKLTAKSRSHAGDLHQVNQEETKHVLHTAHRAVNEASHVDKRFDDSLSGTTSLTVYIKGRTLYVNNVGDSRAIMIRTVKENGKDVIVTEPLSRDQTPYRKDERDRVKSCGARVLSMDQISGIQEPHDNWGDINLGEMIDEEGDPPRIWMQDADYPGTAFSRSIGDHIAEECGVIADPEILVRDIQPDDSILVMATDGVWEFLTNKMVADLVCQYSSPLEATQAVVDLAYDLWLQHEVRTDDITIIIAKLNWHDNTTPNLYGEGSSFYSPVKEKSSEDGRIDENILSTADSTVQDVEGVRISFSQNIHEEQVTDSIDLSQKPVRRTVSREKRKYLVQPKGHEDEELDTLTDADLKILSNPKAEKDAKLIMGAIKNNFLFHHLTLEQRHAVVDVMKEVTFKAGDWIIRQGDVGDHFYILDTGELEVRVIDTVKKLDDTLRNAGHSHEDDRSRPVSCSLSQKAASSRDLLSTIEDIKRISFLTDENLNEKELALLEILKTIIATN